MLYLKFKGLFQQQSLLGSILVLIGFSLVFTLLGAIVWKMSGGIEQNILSLKFLQLIQSIGMFVIPPFVFAYFCTDSVRSFLRISTLPTVREVVFVSFLMIMAVPGINLLSAWNQQMQLPAFLSGVETWMKSTENSMAILTQKILEVRTPAALCLNIIVVALLPAIGEELFFRGAILSIFNRKTHVHMAIWTTAAVFSAIHMQFYGFVPRMLLGALFGYMLSWSNGIWLPVVAHFVNNAIAIVFYYFRYNGYSLPDFDTIGTGKTIWLGFVSLVLTAFAIVGMRKLLQKADS